GAEDGTAGSPVDACVNVSVNGSAGANGCGSSALSAAPRVDLGAGTSTTTTTVDDAGDDAGTVTTTTGGGGITSVPDSLIVGRGPTGVTVSDKATGSYTITGLQNEFFYNVAVAAVDGSGNVGPQSTALCHSPAPVDDFWKKYREAGGPAGGGLCTLQGVGEPAAAPVVTGAALLATVFAFGARRRRGRG
ncbi:MAG: hypothetical protein JOZ69_14820, partial [Myxococcales bacterium]|nr:hypothetical protein [Myxococcales bacterium]